VRPEIGLTFANGLRSILRQSPDVIMVGEIRDFETADIAVKSALIGEIILSTLHTNDAAGAITRLIDMGVEPFLVASSLIMTGAQRLVRKICPHCREEEKIPENIIERFGLDKRHAKGPFYKGKGCRKCNNTGYLSRTGILEALLIDDRIKDMIIKRASSDEIKSYAVRQGMKTLRENALEIFLRGVTTLEEVLKVTSEE
jgi:type II secretory ATPase GspE/PulE/Tfp pilus assembly ATPase PilB-like protein